MLMVHVHQALHGIVICPDEFKKNVRVDVLAQNPGHTDLFPYWMKSVGWTLLHELSVYFYFLLSHEDLSNSHLYTDSTLRVTCHLRYRGRMTKYMILVTALDPWVSLLSTTWKMQSSSPTELSGDLSVMLCLRGCRNF